MDMTLPGYKIEEELSESKRSIVYRGWQESNNQPVVLKFLKHSYSISEEIARFEREYFLTQSLKGEGIIHVHHLERYKRSLVMVLEDFGGRALTHFLPHRPQNLVEFLHLALQIVDGIALIHQQSVIHKDINPANIVWNPATNQVKIIDFGISTTLSRERPEVRNPNVLEGTLAYMSPEQTGRMNRSVDYRTDFYSLGATFYHLLTGQIPFQTEDALELVHHHLAKHPILPHEIKPSLPPIISEIVLKLMAKNAEERYQLSYGLRMDLELCLHQWQTQRAIDPFPLGEYDISDYFQIPQKLYGRSQEIKILLDAFGRVATEKKEDDNVRSSPLQGPRSQTEFVLVSGHAGIGKSSLVQELYKPITQWRGYFISGKFEQFQKNIPYKAFIQAFRSLIKQVLTEDEREIVNWRKKLQTSLSPNGQVLIDVLPELALIIGPQPKVPTLDSMEAQNRFNLVFQNFIELFAQPEHPLVIFLDDLQWADKASLNLIELLVTTSDPHSLLIIGAYRNKSLDETHPLYLSLNKIEKNKVKINHITLSPLNLEHITRLIAETLHQSPSDEVHALAQLVKDKTKGNPFFVNEFLKRLYEEGLIQFNFSRGAWQWDQEQIQERQITDNVVDLMADKIQHLTENSQQVLRLASCMGNRFDLEMLATVYDRESGQTAKELWPAVEEGLIISLNNYDLTALELENLTDTESREYKFVHDRIQQAVYSLIPDSEKRAIHWRVGQLLLDKIPAADRESYLFDIVNQMNLGQTLIHNVSDRDKLAELNLCAGHKAKASAAYEPAFKYFQQGLKLLGLHKKNQEAKSWQRQYHLTLKLSLEAAEMAYLSGDFSTMERLAENILSHTKTLLEKVKVYEIKIHSYQAQGRFLEAIEAARPILKLLGYQFPKKPNKLHVLWALLKTRIFLGRRQPEELLDLPIMTHPYQLAIMRILVNVSMAAYVAMPYLLPLLLGKMIQLSLKYGNSAESSTAYAGYGLILSGFLGCIKTGYRFGQMGLQLSERFGVKKYYVRNQNVVNLFINHWIEHAENSLESLLATYQASLEIGNLEDAALGPYGYCYQSYFLGKPLPRLAEEMALYSQAIAQIRQETFLNYQKLYWQAVLNLMNRSKDPTCLTGELYDEEEMLAFYQKTNDFSGLSATYIQKLVLGYLFRQYSQALSGVEIIRAHLESLIGAMDYPLFFFYESLARLALYPSTSKSEQKRTLKQVRTNQKRLKKWANHAPMNYLHKFYLVEAELAGILNQDEKARHYYEQAIEKAHENGYINEEALAHELAGQFYLKRGQPKFARIYLRDAHYAYSHWGASAKVEDLEQRYPQLFSKREFSPENGSDSWGETDGKYGSTLLDLTSVFKSLQAISGEIEREKLLITLMEIVLENAGAERGLLILEKKLTSSQTVPWVIEIEVQDGKIIWQSIPISESKRVPHTIINYVAHTSEVVVLDSEDHQGQFFQDEYLLSYQPKSILCLPLLNRGELIGMIYLENNLTRGAFTKDRLEVLNLLSSQAAISIENARLYTNLQSSEKKYRALFEESKDTIFVTTPEGEIININPAGIELFGYSRGEVLNMKASDVYKDKSKREDFKKQIEKKGSVKDFPIQLQNKAGKVIECVMTATLRRADDGSNQVYYHGIVRDITAQKEAERERLELIKVERELFLARKIQRSLLPPSRPDWTDLDVVSYSTPAHEIGGDFYAYHAFESERSFAIVVGDVAGKGIPAALFMAVSLASFRSVIDQRMGPSELLTHLDMALEDYIRTERRNCALIYLEITLADKITLHAANAGCIAPLIKRANGVVRWIDVRGIPLGTGLGREIGYQETTLTLSKGDIIILTSDGVLEATNDDLKMFSFDRLEKAVRTGPQNSAQAMLDHLKAEVADFVGTAELHDDLTITVIKI